MTIPALPQHLSALERAQYIRLHRGALKREIRSYTGVDACDVGRAKVAALLALPAEDREVIATARVSDVLRWVRRMTQNVTIRYLAAVGMSEFVTVERMTDRQRLKLIELLEGGIEAVKVAEEDREIQAWVAAREKRVAA